MLCRAVRAAGGPDSAEQFVQIFHGHGPSQQESLDLIAVQRLQEMGLRFGLDAFGYHDESEGMCERDNRRNDTRILPALGEAADECAVYLHAVERQPAEIGQ